MKNIKLLVFTFNDELNKSIKSKYKSKNPDLIIPIGGDGTFINAIQKYIDLNIPFYGIANGTLNFLMNKHKYKDINKLLKKISQRKIKIDYVKTPTLQYFYNGNFAGNVINEIVIGDTLTGFPTIGIKTNDKIKFKKTIKTSALVLSTPLGSTGLNKNIGGKVTPSIKIPLYNLTTVAANTVGSNDAFSKVLNYSKGKNSIQFKKKDDRYQTVVVVDGMHKVLLHKNDVIKVKTGKFIKIGFSNYQEFIIKRITS